MIRGTRIPVELVLRKLGEGATDADLLDAYPCLCREDIQAAIRYAAAVLGRTEPEIQQSAAVDRRSAVRVFMLVDTSVDHLRRASPL